MYFVWLIPYVYFKQGIYIRVNSINASIFILIYIFESSHVRKSLWHNALLQKEDWQTVTQTTIKTSQKDYHKGMKAFEFSSANYWDCAQSEIEKSRKDQLLDADVDLISDLLKALFAFSLGQAWLHLLPGRKRPGEIAETMGRCPHWLSDCHISFCPILLSCPSQLVASEYKMPIQSGP